MCNRYETTTQMEVQRFWLIGRENQPKLWPQAVFPRSPDVPGYEREAKASYKDPWKRGQRCIVPASAFDEPNWETGKNVWWQFKQTDGEPWGLAGLRNTWIDKATGEVHESYTMLTINADEHPLMRRMHKPNPKAPPDKQDKRSVIPLAPADFDQWLEGAVDQAKKLMTVAPVEVFDAAPLDPRRASPEGIEE